MKYEPKTKIEQRDEQRAFYSKAKWANYVTVISALDDLAHAESVIAWQEKEIERLNKLLANEPCPECGLSHEMHFKSCTRKEQP